MALKGRALILSLLVSTMTTLAAPAADSAEWLTKGGSQEHQSVSMEATGRMLEEAWRKSLGQSATQPLVIGRRVYHLADAYLWQMELDASGALASEPIKLPKHSPVPVNEVDRGRVLISQSNPTYSQRSAVIYFGTAYGRLWAYHTTQGWFKHIDIEIGCPIVGAPLVVHDGPPDNPKGPELVVVSDRPNFPGETLPEKQPACKRSHGKVWAVRGLDRLEAVEAKSEYVTGQSKDVEGGFGGFVTPSAVPGPMRDDGPTLVIGADGFAGGRAIHLVLDRSKDYQLAYVSQLDGSAGFAGNFVSNGPITYWMDTVGRLWGFHVASNKPPAGWTGHQRNILPDIGVAAAFTNTDPVVVQRDDGTYLYLTLRNYIAPGTPESFLRAGETGSDGAVVAIRPDGQVEWFRHFGPQDRHGQGAASINTTALAIPSANVLLFGDVNGSLYSYALTSANRQGGHLQPFLASEANPAPVGRMNLLEDGEVPARGWSNFSQVSGVGVDPVMAGGLILVGVNYAKDGLPGGRLVAYRVAPAYNLAWRGEEAGEPLQLREGQPTQIPARPVAFWLFDAPPATLGEVCQSTLAVQWYVTGPGGYVRKLWPEVALPGGLAHNSAEPSAMSVTLEPGDPPEGQIVGIIDHPGLMALAGEHPANPVVQEAVRIGTAADVQPGIACKQASEIIQPPGSNIPLGGLADNLLALPYEKGKPLDDCFVASLSAPKQSPVDHFTARVTLGYRNNLGKHQTTGRLRVWARNAPEVEGPDSWEEVSVKALKSGDRLTDSWEFRFEEMAEGTWELVAEIGCPADTHPQNNQKVAQVVVVQPGEPAERSVGGALTE